MKNLDRYTDFDGSEKRKKIVFSILIILLIVLLIIFCFCFFKRNDYKIEEKNIDFENNFVYNTTTNPNLYSYSEENNNSYNEDNTYLYPTNNNFYNEENNTLNQLNWSSYNEDNSYSNETTFNSACNNNTSLDLHKGSYNNENNSTFNISSNTKTTIGFVIGICFIGYIIAQILSIRGSLIITTGWLDKLLIIISAIALVINALASDAEAKDIANTALIIGLITMGISIIISILANIPNPLYIILSILAKFFLFFLTSFLVAIIIVYLIFSFFVSIMSSSSVDSGWHILEYDPWTNAYFGYRKA